MKGFGTYISPQTAGILKQENPVELYGMEADKDSKSDEKKEMRK